jgi:hypothetical protein
MLVYRVGYRKDDRFSAADSPQCSQRLYAAHSLVFRKVARPEAAHLPAPTAEVKGRFTRGQ